MSIKYTQATLDKIVKVLEEGGYVLRLEKGNFNSGYCVLEHKKVVVVNKFLDMEGRINTLMDILSLLKIDSHTLSAESKKIYEKALKEADGKSLEEDNSDNPQEGKQENQ
jgi:DNA-binding MarR family transcriptional regulator